MTIVGKKNAIRQHCKEHWHENHSCIGCSLYEFDSRLSCSGDDADIERNYELVMGLQKTQPDNVNHPQHEHNGCIGCKHDFKERSELPCRRCRYTLQANNPLYKLCPDLYEPKRPKSPDNPYWERINAIAEQQRTKGINKYGVGLEGNPATIMERINHLQEELIDALMYCEWIKDHLSECGDNFTAGDSSLRSE